MANIRRPRRGSLQYWPHVRARKKTPVVKSWASGTTLTLQGFAGYKVGMTHLQFKDTRSTSPNKGDIVSWPVTIIECPPLRVYGFRFYQKTPYGATVLKDFYAPKLEKNLGRTLDLPAAEKLNTGLTQLDSFVSRASDVHLLVYTQPHLSGLGKKTPEVFEVALGKGDVKSKTEYAKELFDKEIHVHDVFKAGIKVDVHAVTKGKGFKGAVQRFGVSLRGHKSEKKRRANVLGPLRPAKVSWGMILPGQHGYHTRTEYNKDLVLVENKPDRVNPAGGFTHYGFVKQDYVLIRGSIPGATKRLIRFTETIRVKKGVGGLDIQYIRA
ncbi:50S ribosomal protein L3 [Candidatus Woesearchaeota archaeon]|nr:50S ribosomal protein L3 [Candidatus Woesearchaeota archaeon]